MPSYPNEYPKGPNLTQGICAGRGGLTDEIKDNTESGHCQIVLIGKHNYPDGVPLNHIALSTKAIPATGGDQCTFPGQIDYGTMVSAYHTTGSNECVIGFGYNERFLGESAEGDMNLLTKAFMELMSKEDGRPQPPNFKETTRDGAKIRKIDEKGMWKHNLVKGIPTHAAMPTIAGIKLPQIKQIPTAKQHFGNIPTAAMLSNLPSSIMSIASMLTNLMNNDNSKKQITKNMPKDVVDALNSITALSQDAETSETGGSVANGERVNEAVFLANAIELLSQCTTIEDLLQCIERLFYDTDLHGLDELGDTEIEVETPHGNTKYKISSSGEVSENRPDETEKAIQSFLSLMSSATSFASAVDGKNLFGKSSETMFDMFKRMGPEAEKTAITLSKTLNLNNIEKQFLQPIRKIVCWKGGDGCTG